MSCPICKTVWEFKDLPIIFICGKFGDTWDMVITADNIKIKTIIWGCGRTILNPIPDAKK